MRHLNEIVHERNQNSRDAMEVWQHFIILKGGMDIELTKVSKRNNFLVEELKSWKQQLLKFQSFAEQLTKETNELKIKIECHKRENRRLTNLIDQQKNDSARLAVRLSGTEKQRDDALEALGLQQQIAEDLERKRSRYKSDLSALQHTNTTMLRQRDEAQRVVLHLRALIDGQAHHIEHIAKSSNKSPETAEFGDAEENGAAESAESPVESPKENKQSEVGTIRGTGGIGSRNSSRTSTRQSMGRDGEEASRNTDSRPLSYAARKRLSELSMTDVADRQLRDRTDAIAYIIRNISDQCAAAVEGLDLARRADPVSTEGDDEERSELGKKSGKRRVRKMSGESAEGDSQGHAYASKRSESGLGDSHRESTGYTHPKRSSYVPPTPELVHDRSSISMSLVSESTAATSQRQSMQSQYKTMQEDDPDVPTRIVDCDSVGDIEAEQQQEPVTKFMPGSNNTNMLAQTQ